MKPDITLNAGIYCISNYSMIVVKTFWTSTSFDPEKKRDTRSWPTSLNFAIRNKEKAWEEIVSSFDSHTQANDCATAIYICQLLQSVLFLR